MNGEKFLQELVLIPPRGGHGDAVVRLLGRDGPLVPTREVLSPREHYRIDRDSVRVHPTPEADGLQLLLRDGEDEMNVVVHLPRIWWRFGATGPWTDRPIQVSRTKFRTSREKLTVLVPPCIKSLMVGFEGKDLLPVSYAKDVRTKKQAEITLGDFFADHKALGEQRGKNLALSIHLPEGSATAVEVLPGLVDPPVPVEPISSSDSGPRVFRGVIVRRKVFGGVVLEANMDGFVRIVRGKKRRKRVIQDLLPVPRTGHTIPQRVVGIFYKTKVVLHPAATGTGLLAPHPVKAILEFSGVRDARVTTFGTNDPLSLIKATFDGLTRLEDEARTRMCALTQGQRR